MIATISAQRPEWPLGTEAKCLKSRVDQKSRAYYCFAGSKRVGQCSRKQWRPRRNRHAPSIQLRMSVSRMRRLWPSFLLIPSLLAV